MTFVNLRKTLKIQESLNLKISQSIIYVKEYFYIFLSILKDIIQAK